MCGLQEAQLKKSASTCQWPLMQPPKVRAFPWDCTSIGVQSPSATHLHHASHIPSCSLPKSGFPVGIVHMLACQDTTNMSPTFPTFGNSQPKLILYHQSASFPSHNSPGQRTYSTSTTEYPNHKQIKHVAHARL